MPWPRFRIERLMAAIARSRFLATIEGTVIGVALGLIDAHSTGRDWFNSELACLVAGFALGWRHRARSWQAWGSMGWCFYWMHRAAIACGYRPPYVEENADKAIFALDMALWPVTFGLVFGVLARLVSSSTRRAFRSGPISSGADQPADGDAGPANQADGGRALAGTPGAPSTQQRPRRHLTVAGMMITVALIGVQLAAVRAMVIHDESFGFGTVYSVRYSEGRFRTLRVGMTASGVEAIMGRPLRVVPWNQHMGPHDEAMWFYSDQPSATGNFHRRWVLFENDKVAGIVNDFWVD